MGAAPDISMIPDISLIIVSRGRPDHLAALLSALRWQTVAAFETIVVSDGPAPDAVLHIPYAQANIAAARNLGLARASAPIVAFCDDDAIPDPAFLERLAVPFAHPDIAASGGATRGRNGVSMQWTATGFDEFGDDHPIALDPDTPFTVFAPGHIPQAKTIGTVCAFRRDALHAIGGFDPEFRYFLDETDVNMRLARAGWATALVPGAQVHHSFAAGPLRTTRRVPQDLYDIGASKARFCRLHARSHDQAALHLRLAAFRRLHQNRLRQIFALGLLSAAQMRHLYARLDMGIAAGLANDAPSPQSAQRPANAPPLSVHVNPPAAHFLLAMPAPERIAHLLCAAGQMVTILDIRPNAAPLHATYDPAGFWRHRGGQFGRTQRRGKYFALRSYRQYLSAEITRLYPIRPVDYVVSPKLFGENAVLSPELSYIFSGSELKICAAPPQPHA